VGPLQGVALLVAALIIPVTAFGCEVPDEHGNTPWRRAVAKVRYLPDIEAMADMMSREHNIVQYVVSLDEPRYLGGRCWWPVEVRVDRRLWKRYLVTPDGSAMREDRLRAQK